MKKVLLLITIVIHSLAYGQNSNFEWAFDLAASYPEGLTIDSDGNIYVVGYFSSSVDFEPGPGFTYLMAANATDAYISKYSSDGQLVWAKSLECTETAIIREIEIDDQNNIYCVGRYSGTVDFDPGAGYSPSTCQEVHRGFMLKLNSDGDFIHVQEFPSTISSTILNIDIKDSITIISGYFEDSIDVDPGLGTSYILGDSLNSNSVIISLDNNGGLVWGKALISNGDHTLTSALKIMNSGNIIITGIFKSPVDFDPGPGDFTMYASGSSQFFILKLDANGNFIWADRLTGDAMSSHDLIIDSNDNIYISGGFINTSNLSFGSSSNIYDGEGSWDSFLMKVDSNEQIQWTKVITSPEWNNLASLAFDDYGNFYTCGKYSGTIDLNPNWPIDIHTSVGSSDIIVQKYDPLGNLIWTESLGGVGIDDGLEIEIWNNEIYFTGKFDDNVDFDPDTSEYLLSNTGYPIVFIAKWSQDSCSNMNLIIDSVSTSTCTGIGGYASSHAINTIGDVTYEWNTLPPTLDSILITPEPNFYTITANDTVGCTNSKTILIEGPDFFSDFDLQANLVHSNFWAGFQTFFLVDVFNNGCVSTNAQVQLVLSPDFDFNYSSPYPDSIHNDTLFWNLSNFDYDDGHFQPYIVASINPGTALGEVECVQLNVIPLNGDVDSTNNQKIYCSQVVGSYDPNDIAVNPIGVCNNGYVDLDQKLTYTVRFQNTGTAPAVNVHVLDSISNHLDINTISIVGQSHPGLIVEIENDSVARFKFDNIWLPDSTSNEPESHGYVIFEIEPYSPVLPNTFVENKAEIYFDFNEPIITNTVHNTFIDNIPFYQTNIEETSCESFDWNGIIYDSTGIYTQQFYGVDGCDSIVTLNLFIFNPSNIITIDGLTLTSPEGESYQWYDCVTGLPIPGEVEQTLNLVEDGIYAVESFFGSCSDTSDCYTINFMGQPKNDLLEAVSIYPNPVIGSAININNQGVEKEVHAILRDASGRVVFESNIFLHRKTQIPISNGSGVYFLEIISEQGSVQFQIIKL